MARTTKKQILSVIDTFFHKHGNRRQFNITDLSKITAAGISGYLSGGESACEVAVRDACNKYAIG